MENCCPSAMHVPIGSQPQHIYIPPIEFPVTQDNACEQIMGMTLPQYLDQINLGVLNRIKLRLCT